MDYDYDVFISYKRGKLWNWWIHDVFLFLFKGYLEQALIPFGLSGEIFIDKKINPGMNWENKIQSALAKSRCLVSLWCPSYFKSEMCRYELAVIYNRQIKLGYQTIQRSEGLIIPFIINDGENFPPKFQSFQWHDCKNYTCSSAAFKASQKYLEFEEKMIDWVEGIAKQIMRAPPWDQAWLTPEWLNVPVDDIVPPYPKKFIGLPSLD